MGYNIMGYNIKNLNNNNIIFYFLLILIILAGGNLFNRFFNNNKEGALGGMIGGGDDDDDDDSNQQQTRQTEEVVCSDTYDIKTDRFKYAVCMAKNILTTKENEIANPAQHNEVYNETEIKEKENLISRAYKTHKEWVKYNYLKDTPIDDIVNIILARFTSLDTTIQDTNIIELEKAYNKINIGGALGAVGGGFKNATGVIGY